MERGVPAGDTNIGAVRRYYDRTESRLGYLYLLRGTKHFGWYEAGDFGWRFPPAMRRMEHQLGRRLGLDAGSRVLDAGCGMGEVARTMAADFGLDVTGVDILGFDLEEARHRSEKAGLTGSTRFVEGDYHDLSQFEAGAFDGVYTMETFVHAADPERVLTEFQRVLRPGGRLVMFEYSRTLAGRLEPAARAAFDAVCELGAMPTWHRLNHGDLENLLAAASFKVEQVEDVTARMLPMLRAFAVLARVPYSAARRLGKTEKAVNAMSGGRCGNTRTPGATTSTRPPRTHRPSEHGRSAPAREALVARADWPGCTPASRAGPPHAPAPPSAAVRCRVRGWLTAAGVRARSWITRRVM